MTPDKSGPPAATRRTPGKWARRAAILLPFVVAARAILLLFQLPSEHDVKQHERQSLPWPPSRGEVLRFSSGDPRLRDWAADPQHRPYLVAVLEKDFAPQPVDTGCMLNPITMAHGIGTLTLRSRTPSGDWVAEWSGTATMPRLGEDGTQPTSDATAEQRKVEQAMLVAADCGSIARLEIEEPVLHSLVNLLNGEPPPPSGPDGPRRLLHILVDRPTP